MTMTTATREILTDARKLLSTRENWCKGALARRATGESTGIGEGYSFCLAGAVFKSSPHLFAQVHMAHGTETRDAVAELLKLLPLGYGDLTSFNDKSTYEEVVALLDRALND